ncbi:hypothetical protein BU24DRAFT_471787 [Aaosphaeria arxii CBS 175.79]|uniref:F-box domain-containing protein n=1 Tax=Aaosphaeria arxii CBS 175.79 TaxID=1450172 RepID=A0A6A5XCC7_9PLEO|nr:uncharacterized protein BU24DRAFT_471787 [Aaosphaeria arxii CBS 175.79]KAF2010755.1 hypothetical protein BU24DRAFT_471787 [Aaosphaeria arxii CBS 175.79]
MAGPKLITLPSEIRNQILSELLCRTEILDPSEKAKARRLDIAILRVCKSLAEDGAEVLYRQNHFHFGKPPDVWEPRADKSFGKWLEIIGGKNIARLRKLDIQLKNLNWESHALYWGDCFVKLAFNASNLHHLRLHWFADVLNYRARDTLFSILRIVSHIRSLRLFAVYLLRWERQRHEAKTVLTSPPWSFGDAVFNALDYWQYERRLVVAEIRKRYPLQKVDELPKINWKSEIGEYRNFIIHFESSEDALVQTGEKADLSKYLSPFTRYFRHRHSLWREVQERKRSYPPVDFETLMDHLNFWDDEIRDLLREWKELKKLGYTQRYDLVIEKSKFLRTAGGSILERRIVLGE